MYKVRGKLRDYLIDTEGGKLMLTSGVIVGGIVLYVNYKQRHISTGNDHGKIIKIADSCGLYKKDGKGNKKSLRIWRKRKIEGGTEYVYQIPLGMAFSDFTDKLDHFQDGLNISSKKRDISFVDIKGLKLDKTFLSQVKELVSQRVKTSKEVQMDYDGMLKIRVYDNPLPEKIDLTDDMLKACKGWEIPLGMSRDKMLRHDMEHGHMVVAGLTRGGKTVFLKTLITSLISRKPKEAQFALIDLKGGLAFTRFKDCSQVKYMAHDVESAHEVLGMLVHDMKMKWNQFREKGYEDIGEAGIKERMFVIIDEGAELASKDHTGEEKKIYVQCERYMSEIARLGAGLGYRLVYATQYPVADVLPRQVKQNAPTRICFRVATDYASNVVLDQYGAEKLPDIKGRAMVVRSNTEIVQCPYIDNGFIKDKVAIHIRPRSEDNEHKEAHSEIREDRGHIGFIETPRLPHN